MRIENFWIWDGNQHPDQVWQANQRIHVLEKTGGEEEMTGVSHGDAVRLSCWLRLCFPAPVR